ncbi:uncharacterized protein LOC143032827 isoform X2 [Oratosquilla oratoria]|uniref:uncharacterized protein LOC143032827 isoform X2 n=1 Tax=Oratosquilla oratoria TaxID=337810 RepID=UPI003F76177F
MKDTNSIRGRGRGGGRGGREGRGGEGGGRGREGGGIGKRGKGRVGFRVGAGLRRDSSDPGSTRRSLKKPPEPSTLSRSQSLSPLGEGTQTDNSGDGKRDHNGNNSKSNSTEKNRKNKKDWRNQHTLAELSKRRPVISKSQSMSHLMTPAPAGGKAGHSPARRGRKEATMRRKGVNNVMGGEETHGNARGGSDTGAGGRGTAGVRRRKPHSLPPLERKPKSPLVGGPHLEHLDHLDHLDDPGDLTTSSGRFIGSPPPSALKSRDGLPGSELQDDSGSSSQRAGGGGGGGGGVFPHASQSSSSSATGDYPYEDEDGEDERTVYEPQHPSLEASHPKITLNAVPHVSSPAPPNSIVAAQPGHPSSTHTPLDASVSSLSLRSVTPGTTESTSLRQVLTPPPKLVTYRQDGTEAVQEWKPQTPEGPTAGESGSEPSTQTPEA